MKKQKIDLVNTTRRAFVEFSSFRSAEEAKRIHSFALEDTNFKWKKESVAETIKRLQPFIHWPDVYRIRIRFDYWKNKKRVKTKRTKFFYTEGKIYPKQTVIDYFSFNPAVAKRISALAGEKVFWIHYEVQHLNEQNDYSLIERRA